MSLEGQRGPWEKGQPAERPEGRSMWWLKILATQEFCSVEQNDGAKREE